MENTHTSNERTTKNLIVECSTSSLLTPNPIHESGALQVQRERVSHLKLNGVFFLFSNVSSKHRHGQLEGIQPISGQ